MLFMQLLKLFKKEEGQPIWSYDYSQQKKFFRRYGKYYIAKKTQHTKNDWTLWAVGVEAGDNDYLGMYVDNKLIMSEDFYSLPWDIKKYGQAMFDMFMEFIETGTHHKLLDF